MQSNNKAQFSRLLDWSIITSSRGLEKYAKAKPRDCEIWNSAQRSAHPGSSTRCTPAWPLLDYGLYNPEDTSARKTFSSLGRFMGHANSTTKTAHFFTGAAWTTSSYPRWPLFHSNPGGVERVPELAGATLRGRSGGMVFAAVWSEVPCSQIPPSWQYAEFKILSIFSQ